MSRPAAGTRLIRLPLAGALLILFCLVGPSGQAQPATAALSFNIGIQGSLSFFEAGVVAPALSNGLTLGLKARVLSSLTWATFIHRNGQSVSFHPVVVGGVLSCGGASPLFEDAYRMYGGMDVLVGYSFTPYDSLIYRTGNLIGRNLTFALWGYYGIELFTAEKVSYCLDSGGGFKSLRGDRDNLYAIASSWLGSGFGLKTGMRFYL